MSAPIHCVCYYCTCGKEIPKKVISSEIYIIPLSQALDIHGTKHPGCVCAECLEETLFVAGPKGKSLNVFNYTHFPFVPNFFSNWHAGKEASALSQSSAGGGDDLVCSGVGRVGLFLARLHFLNKVPQISFFFFFFKKNKQSKKPKIKKIKILPRPVVCTSGWKG